MSNTIATQSAALATAILLSATAKAAIVVTSTDSFGDAANLSPKSYERTISEFSVTAGGKLVVTTAMENGDISGITFNGSALTSAYNTTNSLQRITTYYLDVATATTGDIVVSITGTTTLGIGAIAFTGAASGGPADFASSASKNSGSFDTQNGSLVIGSFAVNATTTITPGTTSTAIYNKTSLGSGGTAGDSSYYFSTTDGTESFGFTSSGNDRPAAGAVVFNAIPEPSSAVLLALGSLALLRRRR